MIPRSDIQAYCDAIAREFKPEKIILFGSYAYGTPTEDSDVDLMVVMPVMRVRGIRTSLKIRQRLDSPFPMDLLVRTPADVKKRLAWGDSFISEVFTKGKVMYETRNHRMGRQSRGRLSASTPRNAATQRPKTAA
jgi:predicted nucleotidyltransferase